MNLLSNTIFHKTATFYEKDIAFGVVDSVILRMKITESRLIEFLTHRWCYKMAARSFYKELV